jgi:hypothetical protein
MPSARSPQATADVYAVRIYVVQRQAPDDPTPIEPNVASTRVRGELWLDFEPEVHYNCLTYDDDEDRTGSHHHHSPPGSSAGSSSSAAFGSRRRLSGDSQHEPSGGWGLDFLWSSGDATHTPAQDPHRVSPPSSPSAVAPSHQIHHRSSPQPTYIAASHSHRPPREHDVVTEACFDRPSRWSAVSTASIPVHTPMPPLGFHHTDDAYLHPVTTGQYQPSSSDEVRERGRVRTLAPQS